MHDRRADYKMISSWLALSNAEKLEYIRAVKCLDTLPSKGNYSAARTRRDDWTAMHIFRSRPTVPSYIPGNISTLQVEPPGIHFNGIFLPWHRYYLLSFETALIEECGYKGAQPYWDWTIWTPRNKRKFADSPIFDPTYGFGGNGVGQSSDGKASTGYDSRGGSCVTDGPFANLTLTLGPGYNLSANPHCLKRKFFVLANDTYLGPEMITDVLKEKNYFDMIMAMTKSPDLSNPKRYGVHTTGHIGPGGEEADFWSSPNDPIFVVHHANLDRVWDSWQDQAPENLYAINGPTSMGKGLTRGPGNTTLDDMLEMSPDIAPNLPARALMDSLNKNGKGISCVRYE
ncbi:Di-copper centre-containing protein [Venturia nashicola]|nr:Di-copper centre-containing protein [Venturia nashicola]